MNSVDNKLVQGPTLCTILAQVRSFAKEAACCERYEAAQNTVLSWGLKSAVAGSFFFAFNYIVATGALITVLWSAPLIAHKQKSGHQALEKQRLSPIMEILAVFNMAEGA